MLGLKRRERKGVPEFLQVPWGIRDVLLFVATWLGLQVVIILLLRELSPVIAPVGSFLKLVRDGNVDAIFALNVLDAGIGFGLVWWFLRRYKVGWQTLGFRKVDILKTAGYIVGILFFFVVISNVVLKLLSILVPGFNADQAQDNEFISSSGSHHSLAIIALVLMPPILEETIFRGFVFPAITKRTGVIWGAVLSSALFGLAHWQANISIYTFVLGLLLCFLYVRTRSIVPGIVLHMVNNYLAFVALSGR